MAEQDSTTSIPPATPAADSDFLTALVGAMVTIELLVGDFKTLRSVVGELASIHDEYLLIQRPGNDRPSLIYKHAIALITPSNLRVG